MLDDHSGEALLYITSLAEKTPHGYAYTAKTLQIDIYGAVQNINIRLISDELLTVKPYRIIKADVKFFTSGSNAFDSFGYWSKNIYLYADLDSFSFTDYRVKSILEPLLYLRADIIETIKSNVNSDAGALSAALLTGDKSGLSDTANSMFKAAGASHLMAVSGLHLSVSVGFAVSVMKKLRVNNKIIFSVSIVLIFCYSSVAGFSKSVVRAGIMMAVMLLGNAVGKRSDTLNALGLALFILCLNPFAVSDIGMLLSTLAVLSISTLYPVFRKYTNKLKSNKDKKLVKHAKMVLIYVLNTFFLSLSVMLFTLPVMYVYFGYVSLAGLLSNIVLSPLGACSLMVSFLSYSLSGSVSLSVLLFKISEFLCNAILFFVKAFAQMKFATLPLSNTFALILAGVLVVFSFCFFLCNKKLMKKAGALCSVIVIVFVCVSNAVSYNDTTMYVCRNSSVVIQNQNDIIVCYADDKDYYDLDNYIASHGRKMDYLFVQSNTCAKAAELSDKYSCREITGVGFDVLYLNNTNAERIIVAPHNKVVAENIVFSYNCTDGTPYYILNYKDSIILIGDVYSENCDITIGNHFACDINGSIDLSKGNIEYTISSKHIFSVRRLNSWQD